MNNKIQLLIFLTVFCVSILPVTGFCISSDELALLKMYYASKDLVSSTTRNVKPVSQVAENITVITAKDIRDMNAHTLNEVLNRVPGLFNNFNRDFGGTSLIHMQGAEDYHTLVLVDGLRWNSVMEKNVRVNGIPVEIVERIEIIKGPASSSWGSALGGVINIITKHLDFAESSSGTVYGSFGEGNTSDIRAGYTGNLDKARYYVYAGKQDSDGIHREREFENSTFFSKIRLHVLENGSLQFSFGYTEPDQKLFFAPEEDWEQYLDFRTIFGNAALDAWISANVKLNFSFHFFDRESDIPIYYPISPRGLWAEFDDEERLIGGSGMLSWYGDNHSLTVGVDANYGDVDSATHSDYGPSEYKTADENDWAAFINDTMVYGKWTITPGVRYNYNSIYGSFISPSIGVTYYTEDKTILRCSVARGFNAPPLTKTTLVGNDIPNPDLDPEKMWSYQLGAESGVGRYFLIKSTFFYHRLSDEFVEDLETGMWVNRGSSERKGLEIEVETIPLWHICLGTGASWVRSSPEEGDSFNVYSYAVNLKYDKKEDLTALFSGQYVQGVFEVDDFIWDFNLNKRLFSKPYANTWLTFKAHNLFNGRQYDYWYYNKNPRRWFEAGIRINFS